MMGNSKEKFVNRYFGEVALLLMTLIWGGTFVIVKLSLKDISSMLFIAFRFGLASVILTFIFIFRKVKLDKKSLLPGFLLGSTLFVSFCTQTIGLKSTSATKSGFVTGISVVLIPFFQIFVEKKKPSKGAVLGTILVFIGLLFLSSPGNSVVELFTEIGSSFNFGDALTLICAITFGFYVVQLDVETRKHDFKTLLITQLLSVTLLSLAASFLFAGLSYESLRVSITEYLLFGLLYTGVLATLINLFLQTKYQKFVSPTKAGIIYSFEPIFAATLAFFILGEKITNFGMAGCALIFSGLLMSEVFDSLFEKINENLQG
jgi:drug/metabolite transporter (DMT)-like permease